jgi:hypothetical protein
MTRKLAIRGNSGERQAESTERGESWQGRYGER